MSAYRLVDHGYPFKKIVSRGRWVGRVVKHAERPVYVGKIGKLFVEAPTEIAAFEKVVAQHLGHPDVESLRATNAANRAANRAASRAAFARIDRETGGLLSQLNDLARRSR